MKAATHPDHGPRMNTTDTTSTTTPKDNIMTTTLTPALIPAEVLDQIVAECEHLSLHLAEDLEVIDGASAVEVDLAEEGIGEGIAVVQIPFVEVPRTPEDMLSRLENAYAAASAASDAEDALEGIICDGVVNQYLVYLARYVAVAAERVADAPRILLTASGSAMEAAALADVLEGLEDDLEEIHASESDAEYDPMKSLSVHIAHQVIEDKHEKIAGVAIFLAMHWLRGGDLAD